MHKRSRVRQRQRGNAMVESALGMTVFLMLFFGIIDFSRAIWNYNTLSYATRVGVRYAIIHGSASGSAATSDDISSVVQTRGVGLDSRNLTVTTTWTPNNKPGSVVLVQATYQFTPLLPFMPAGPYSLQSAAQMVISQ